MEEKIVLWPLRVSADDQNGDVVSCLEITGKLLRNEGAEVESQVISSRDQTFVFGRTKPSLHTRDLMTSG